MSSTTQQARYGVVVPIKPPAVAKSRLAALGDQTRRDLVVAFAMDTVVAALDCPVVDLVLAVTDDYVLASGLAETGAAVIPDGTVDDLNASLVQGVAEVHRRRPELRVAALCADLPALRPEELARALEAGRDDRQSFVTDDEGSGTTLVFAPSPDLFLPRFGPGSRQAHLADGAYEIDLEDIPSLRRDVDTPADLSDAVAMGVGGRTALVATAIRL